MKQDLFGPLGVTKGFAICFGPADTHRGSPGDLTPLGWPDGDGLSGAADPGAGGNSSIS